ncbi:MAG: acyltransferase family protein [Lachnospiraceae bacterium]|nr:acyltransferase family protein [Lachnospiraceae bacterium]
MSKRLQGLDLYRIIGCAFVIINHCNSKVLLQVTPGSLAWYVTVGVIYLSKITVPGFFMITGYNLLHRKDDRATYFKRIVRIVGVLVVFSIFYYLWRNGLNGSIGDFLRTLWHDGATDAFWYLYTYLGLMVMMPLFQWAAGAFDGPKADDAGEAGAPQSDASAKAAPDRRRLLVMILLAASVYVSLMPSVCILVPSFTMNEYFELPMIGCAVMYLFIGHAFYLYRDEIRAGKGVQVKNLRLTAAFFAAFAVNIALAMAEKSITGGVSFTSFSEIHTVGMLAESLAAFAFLVKIRGEGLGGKLIGFVAPATFGIYLLADFVCSSTHMLYYNLCQYMNRLLAVAVQDIVAFAIALAVVTLLRLIPPVKKWI